MRIPRITPRYLTNPLALAACFATVLTGACGSSTLSGGQKIGGQSGTNAAGGAPESGGAGGVPTGGAGGTGGMTAAGGTAVAGGAVGSGGSPMSRCCQKDFDCGDAVYEPCVNGVCKNTVSGACWTSAECRDGETCIGVFVCGCGLLCAQDDAPGRCEPSIADGGRSTDASADSGQPTCLPPPTLPPTSPTCTALPYNAASESYTLWIADPSAPGGGQALSLATNQAMTVGGHTYKNTGAGLVGGGVHGVYGDAWFDVDGVANALGFHFEGCAVAVATDTWEMVAAVTRSGPSCLICPETIERHYTIRHTGSGSAGRYTFDAEGSPQGCGPGADLLEIVLYQ